MSKSFSSSDRWKSFFIELDVGSYFRAKTIKLGRSALNVFDGSRVPTSLVVLYKDSTHNV